MLSKAELKKLRKAVADIKDRKRYMIFTTHDSSYDISGDIWHWSKPEDGTLFKRQEFASLIAVARKGVVVPVRVDSKDRLVIRSLPKTTQRRIKRWRRLVRDAGQQG